MGRPKIYSDKFKATAVKLSQLKGVAVMDVAESLVIHPIMLSRWRKEVREGLIDTEGIEVNKEEMAELKELRRVKRQYERLKIEHKLLKNSPRAASDSLWSERNDRCILELSWG